MKEKISKTEYLLKITELMRARFEEDAETGDSKTAMTQAFDDKNMLDKLTNIFEAAEVEFNTASKSELLLCPSSVPMAYSPPNRNESITIEALKECWKDIIAKPATSVISDEDLKKFAIEKGRSLRSINRDSANTSGMNAKQIQVYNRFRDMRSSTISKSITSTKVLMQLLELVVGCPGTGKSFLIKHICDLFHPCEYVIVAPTSKVAVLLCASDIKAKTLQSEFYLGIHRKLPPLSIVNRKIMQDIFKRVQLIVVDEIYMVDSTIFQLMDLRLKDIFGDDLSRKDADFAGIHVLLTGP